MNPDLQSLACDEVPAALRANRFTIVELAFTGFAIEDSHSTDSTTTITDLLIDKVSTIPRTSVLEVSLDLAGRIVAVTHADYKRTLTCGQVPVRP